MIVAVLAGSTAAMWAAAILAVRHNHRYAPSIDDERPLPTDPPPLLIVVPARNEEQNIGPCLDAICASDYRRLRVRVVDDGSTDRTPDILRAAARADPRVDVLTVQELPAGWLGKNHALWLGTRDAREDWLLFVDADLRVAPSCIGRAVAAAHRTRADLLTLIPKLEMVTFWEIVAQSIVAHFIVMLLDSRRINSSTSRRAGASGPFLLFRRAAYEAIGGHESVRAEVVEDVRLAEAVKRAKMRLVLVRGTRVAGLRMYDSLGAIVHGWSKNFHVLLRGMNWLMPPAAAAMLWFYAAPWVLPVVAVACGDRLGAAAWSVATLVVVGARLDFAHLYGVTARRQYLAPLGALVIAWILVRSVLGGSARRWKGRPV